VRETPPWYSWVLGTLVALVVFYVASGRGGFLYGVMALVAAGLLIAGFIVTRQRVRDRGLRMGLRIVFVYGFLALCTYILQAQTFLYATWAVLALVLGALELLQRPR